MVFCSFSSETASSAASFVLAAVSAVGAGARIIRPRGAGNRYTGRSVSRNLSTASASELVDNCPNRSNGNLTERVEIDPLPIAVD